MESIKNEIIKLNKPRIQTTQDLAKLLLNTFFSAQYNNSLP